ncbi:MAG TPA: hypothetical protein VG870_07985 [Chitinophagaceae bacterium]|nr:hypothetical protein [Chitinophagaceae bacterium]
MIVNDHDIYPIRRGEKLVIPLSENNPRVVITDGMHITKPLELIFHHVHTYYFKIVCAIDDFQLIAGLALMVVFALLALATGFLAFKVLSIFPLLYVLFLYYINRKDFLQFRNV